MANSSADWKKKRFEETFEEMESKYGNKEETKKTTSTTSTKTTTTSSNTSSKEAKQAEKQKKFDDFYAEMEASYNKSASVDETYINTFFKDAQSFLNRASSVVNGLDWKSATSGERYDSWSKEYASMQEKEEKIRSYLRENKDLMDSSTHKEISSLLDTFHWSSVDAKVAFNTAKRYFSQWKTEDEYNEWKKDTEEYEAMLSYDTKKGAKEIEDLMKQAEADEKEYWDLYDMRTSYLYNASLGQPDDISMGIEARMQEILDKYGAKDINDIQNQITKKKQYQTQAERLQEGVRLGSVGDMDSEYYDPEYAYWANTRGTLPTREDLVAYDSMMDQSTWYTDADGKLYDAYGTEIDPYKTDAQGNILHPSQGSVDSSDKLGIYLAASEEDVQEAAGTYLSTGGTWETIVAEGSQKHWNRMTEAEVNNYYYYLNKDGSEAAEKYLDSIQETLNYREGTEKYKSMEDNTALELLFGISAGLDQFNSGLQGLRNAITGNDEYVPVTATQVASSMAREDLADNGAKLPDWLGGGSLAQAGYDAITTTTNMLPSILTSVAVNAIAPGAGGVVGTGLLSASAGGNAYTEMINLGYDADQSRTYAAMVGASEAVLQSLLGGVSKLGGGAISKGITKVLGKADNALAKIAIKFGNSILGKVIINAAEEGVEEYFQAILEPVFKNIIFGEENDIDLLSEEALYSALLGALTGGFFESSGVAAETANTNAMLRDTGKAILGADGGVDALKALAMDVSGANNKLTKQANKVSSEATISENLAGKVVAAVKNSNNQKKVGKLYQAVEAEVTAQNQADIAKALNENGFSKSSAKNIAEAVVAKLNGVELNKFQTAVLESVKDNKMVDETVNRIINDPESGVSKRTGNMDTYSVGIMLGKGIAPEATREAQKTTLKVSEEGKTIANGREIEVQFADNGLIATEDGTVTVSDVEYSSATEAYVVETIANLGLKADAANSLLRTANAKGMNELQAQAFATGLKTAYNMGRIGNLAELNKNYFTSKLTSEQRIEAYSAGLRERNAEVAARQTAINEAQKKAEEILAAKTEPIDKRGKVIFEDGISEKALSKKKKAAYLVARKVSSTMGNDIHLYNGKVEYGYHDAETGDVWLNINASASGKDLTLFTLSHEIVHHASEWSPEEFTAFADFLLEAYGEKGKSVEQMIAKQIRKAKSHGIQLTREGAYEEVICDACERMLIDSNALEKLSILEETHPGIIEKIKAFLQKFLEKIREMFKDVEPNTDEAIYLSEMEDSVKTLLYEKFENLMVSTAKTYSTIRAAYDKDVKAVPNHEIITNGAVTIEGDGKKYSIKSMKHDIAEGKMFEDLRTVCGWTEAETTALKDQLEDIVSYMTPFRDIVDMNETSGRDDRRFSPYKPNSDPLYTISMDFSTLCSKRLLTQYVIENLQLRENRPMSAEEQIAIRDMLIEYRQQEKALQVACAMCYVEAARLKSPKQMSKWMNDPSSFMRDYFADRDPDFKQKILDAQADFKESRGYDRNATKKDMKPKDVKELNQIRPNLRKNYTPTAEEQAIIDRAVSLPNSVYLTAGNLADLSESDPIIYKAYTSFVRTATRSKGLEQDIAYYYGDSTRDNGNGIIVSDSFIESVNRENGMRFSSWSDWRIEHLLDYITAVIDNSVRGAAMHGYTKFPDEVRVLGNTGMMFNMSGVAGTQTGLNEDGSLSFSETESINFEEAKALREEFPETAGLQCIGVGDEHIRQMLRSDIIDYVIPYHTSGLNAVLRRMVNIHGWKDYTGTQNASIDKSISKENAKDPENWHKEPVFSEFFVGYDTGMTGVEAMKKSADNYIRMCRDRGMTPKFAQFMDEDGYWKLLIDRKMVNNKTGNLIQQKPVKPVFNTETIKGIVDKYVDNYDSGLQSKALNHIVENWDSLPARIKDLKKAKKSKAKKALDTLANETVAAQPGRKFALPQMGDKKDPTTLSEQDLRELLTKAAAKKMDDGTFFPIRINTPDILLSFVEKVEKWKGVTGAELERITADNPVVMPVKKARQAMAIASEWYEDGDPHELAVEDVITIIKKMDTPRYLVYEDSTGRYVEIINYVTTMGDKAVAVVEVDQHKGESHMNGYDGSRYSVLVTMYPPDSVDRVKKLLNNKNNIVFDTTKKKGNPQVTSGILVPPVLTKLPFAPTVPQEEDVVKNGIEKPTDNKYIKMVEEGATHIGEYDVVPKSKVPKKTILAWKALVVKPGAKNNPKDKSYGNMYPPQVHQVASTPYGVWLYANEAPKKLGKDGNPVLTKYGRPKVKEGMTYRPAWHFGDAPYASQFRSTHGFFDDNGVRRFYMSESKGILVWALCEMAADENYQDEADMAGHIGENRYWDEQQASLWYLPENGYYKYMTNRVDPNSVTWYLSDKMRIVQTITDAEMRDILTWIKEDGSTDLEFNYPLRIDGKDVNPADYGVPVGNVVGDGIDYVDRWKNQFREIAMNGEIDITQSHFYYVPSTATSYGDYETVSFSKEVDDHSQELVKTKKDAKILFVNSSSKSALVQSFETSTGVKVKDAKTMEGRKRIIEAAKNEGYDIVEFAKEAKGLDSDVVIVNPDAVIRNYKFNNVSERHGRSDAVKYSLPTSEDISTRTLLANAFESVAQNDIERERLSEYKAKISFVNAKEQRLRELNAKLFQSKTPIPRSERIALQDEAVKLRNQITIYDAQLLRLEASRPLQNVLNREKAKVRKQMKEQAKQDIREAKLEEQQRYKNRVANHEKVEMRKKIRKTIRDLDKILNHGDKKKNVKDDMKGLVSSAIQSAEVLFTENYSNEDIIQNGFGVQLGAEEQKHFVEAQKILQQILNLGTGYEAMVEREKLKNKLSYRMAHLRDAFFRERNRLNETRVSEVLGNLADAYSSLESSEYLYIKDAYHASVHEYLMYLKNEVGGTTVRNMSMSQLENLHKAYTMVLETVRNANKMFNEKLKESRDQLANAIMREVRMAGGEHGDWSKLSIKRNKFSWNNMKPIYAAERIGSETFSRVVSGLFDGQYKWATNMEKARAFQVETAQKHGANNWDMEQAFKFTSSNGLDFTLNLEQVLALYAYSKREAAHDHITNGGIVFGKNTEVIEDKHGIKIHKLKRSATTYSISDTLLGEIISKLDDSQKKYVDEMQKYLSETMGGLGNEVSMKLYGVKLFGEENYFPLRSAGQYMEKAREADLQKQQGHTSLVNSGFTHAVKPHAKNPIVLDGFMDVWAGHVNEMAMYNGMVLPMEDFRKVYNYHTPFGDGSSSVNGVIENAYGAEATGYFDQLYQELNSGAISDPRESDMLKWVGKFKKASVMMSMSVVVQQPSAIGRAFALIDPKYFIGQKISESDSKKQWDEVKKYAPVAIIKEMGGFDTHTGASAKDFLLAKEYSKDEIGKALLKDKDYRKETCDMVMGYLPAKADELTWVAIWQAVKREVKAKNPTLTGEAFLKKAGSRFSEVIEKTQVYDSILARSANMRAKTGLMTMATAFMAEPTTTINMVENAIRSKKNVGRVLASVAVSIILNNLLASAIYAMRDDDEDETFLEKYAQAFTSGMVDDLNPVTYYPFLKDVWSIFQGYDVERSDMSIISDVSDALKKVVQLLGKDTSDMDEDELAEYHKTVWSAALSLVDGAFSAMGIPFKNARREVESWVNTYRTATNGLSNNGSSLLKTIAASAADALPVASYVWKTEKSDNLYDAIISGNTAYEARLRSEYDDEKQITNAIRKGLRENDSRIYEAALAQIDGHPEERVKLQREVIADGFTQDDVIIATNTIINKLSPSTSTSEPKKKGLYSTEDFARFVAGGKTALASEAKQDIIATHQLNGKTADEAEKSFQSSAKTDLKEMFLAGTVTVAAAEHALKTYCGMDSDDAKTKVNEWAFEDKYGFIYSDRGEAYKSGAISASELRSILINVGGKTEEEADLQIKVYDWQEEGFDIDSDQTKIIERYEGYCEPAGIDKATYYDFYQFYNESGEEGVSYSKTIECMPYINSLPLSASQKDAIALSIWAASTVNKYKTW